MVELVDTLVLGASAERREGSSPFIRTKIMSERLPETAEDMEKLLRAENIEEAATRVFIEAWRLMRSGQIDPRSRLADATLLLQGALSPNAVTQPNWLPEELREESDA